MQLRLSKVVGRTENIVTPVEGDDIFPILHRRLFSDIGDPATHRAVADAYADWYESLGDAVPPSFREAAYRERLATAYPFHPELVDILTAAQYNSLFQAAQAVNILGLDIPNSFTASAVLAGSRKSSK